MKSKVLIILIICIPILAAIAYTWFWLNESYRSERLKNAEQKRISDTLQQTSEKSAKKAAIGNTTKPSSIWQKLPLSALPESFKTIRQPSDTAILVDLSRLRAAYLSVGDMLSFTIPENGYSLSVIISEIREQPNGITVLKSEPNQYFTNYVTIILGQKTTLGNFFTPAGEYELLGNLEAGWLAHTRSLPGLRENDYIMEKAPVMLEKPSPLTRPLPIRE